jgi:hypothetical protein
MDEILDKIDSFLQLSNGNTKERLDKINELLSFLNYNKRLTELSKEEKLNFVEAMEGANLTDKQRKILNESDVKMKDHYIEMWARSTYFRRCAWISYLHGKGDIPTIS